MSYNISVMLLMLQVKGDKAKQKHPAVVSLDLHSLRCGF